MLLETGAYLVGTRYSSMLSRLLNEIDIKLKWNAAFVESGSNARSYLAAATWRRPYISALHGDESPEKPPTGDWLNISTSVEVIR